MSITPPKAEEDVGPAHSFYCDRRYSRLAREIVRRWVLPLLEGYYHIPQKNRNKQGAGSSSSSYSTPSSGIMSQHSHYSQHEVDVLVRAIPVTSDGCPLDPRLDIFQFHDSHMSMKKTGYLCGICGKTFTSQQYLDRHFDNRHSHQISDNSIAKAANICPARDLCAAFGDACNILARHNTSSNDQMQMPSCEKRSQNLVLSRQTCVNMMERCFLLPSSNEVSAAVTQDLIYHVCYPFTKVTAGCTNFQDQLVTLPSYPYEMLSSVAPLRASSYLRKPKISLFLIIVSPVSLICLISSCWWLRYSNRRSDRNKTE